jgi:anti-sigma regulatory factor (Ser/Thr protein kinase)
MVQKAPWDGGQPDSDRASLPPLDVLFAARASASGHARRELVWWLAGAVTPAALADAELLLSELVTNSIKHARLTDGAQIRVRAVLAQGVLRLEVEDDGDGASFAARAPDYQLGGGFGLYLVERLAARWGVERAAGTRVWLELPVV